MQSYKHIFIIVAIVLATAIAFSPCLKNQFVNWDDPAHLLNNEHVRSLSWEGIKNIFSQRINRTFIPLTVLTYAVEYHFFQYEPFVYHLTNLILHLIVVALVYKLALSLKLPPVAAGLAALIFGIHPVHVESVAWITGRKDLLYSIFYLMAAILYIRYLERRSKAAYMCSLGCCLVSILSKPMALSLPLALWAIDWTSRRERTQKLLLDKIPYFLVIVPVALITFVNLGEHMAAQSSVFNSFILYVWSFMAYIRKFFYPVHLGPVHEMSKPIALSNPAYFLPIVLLFMFIVLLIYFRRDRFFVFAFIFYFVSIFFLLRGRVIFFSAQMISDRYMYLPCLGFCLWLGDDAVRAYLKPGKRVMIKRLIQIILIGGVLFWWGTLSFRQCRIWKDGGTLWPHALKYFPDSPVANSNMADFLLKKGVVNQKVLDHCRKAIKTHKKYPDAHVNLGSVLAQMGQVDEAVEHFREAIEMKPDHRTAHANLATALLQQGNKKEALIHAQKAIELGFSQPGIYQVMEQARQIPPN